MEDKKRAPNFSEQEVTVLVNLVRGHKNVIECKKSDAVSWKEKKAEWELISKEFNENTSYPRTAKTIRDKYRNIKKQSKRKFADERLELFKTGGGPPKHVIITETDRDVKEMCGLQITGLENNYDSDFMQGISHETQKAHEEIRVIIESCDEYEDTMISQAVEGQSDNTHEDVLVKNWGNWNPALLKTQTSKPLRMETQGSRDKKQTKTSVTQDCKKKFSILSEAKLELIKIQIDCLQKELACKEKESELRILFLKEEHGLKILQMKEKHRLETEILKKRLSNK